MGHPVIVVGSVNADLVFDGVPRLPLPGETIRAATFSIHPGGKGANQASAAARSGADTRLIAAVGSDDLGAMALADLTARGVDLRGVLTLPMATGTAAVLLSADGENSIVIAAGANGKLGVDSVVAAPAVDHAVVVACLEIPIDTVMAWARHARARGWTFVLTPAPARPLPADLLALVDVLVPNRTEMATVGDPVDLLAAGVGAVVVTLGGDGCEVHRHDRAPDHQAAFPVTVRDTTGAGDTFVGVLATGLASELDLDTAVRRASAAGAIATSGFGARSAQPSADEIDDLILSTGSRP